MVIPSPFLFLPFFQMCWVDRLFQMWREILEGFLGSRYKTKVTHLQFTNDTIFFSRASAEDLYSLNLILLVFGHFYELKANLDKSTLLGINISKTRFLELATFLDSRISDRALLLGSSFRRKSQNSIFLGPVVGRISCGIVGRKPTCPYVIESLLNEIFNIIIIITILINNNNRNKANMQNHYTCIATNLEYLFFNTFESSYGLIA